MKGKSMDPNELLAIVRERVRHASEDDLLAEAISDLDDWLTKGGFLPDAWCAYAPAQFPRPS